MKTIDILRQALLVLAVTFAAGLLFVNVYNSVVDANNWGHDFPNSIYAARAYFSGYDPRHFYRVASPINQLLGLASLILCWKVDRRLRWLCAAAAACAIAGDMMTFAYFYPRNDIMFRSAEPLNWDAIRAAHAQWTSMNWVRSGVVALGLVNAFLAYSRFFAIRLVGATRTSNAIHLQQTAA